MKRVWLLALSVVMLPSTAMAFDWKWSVDYDGIAGGTEQMSGPAGLICEVARRRARWEADKYNCARDPTGFAQKNGLRIGQSEMPCTCQCADMVCLCTDRLEIICLSRGN